MQLLDDGTLVYSATDLAHAAECEYALLRRLDVLLGRGEPVPDDGDGLLAAAGALGAQQEADILAGYVESYGRWEPGGRGGVVEVAHLGGSRSAVEHRDRDALTLAALRGGVDVVAQGYLFDGRFGGYADFIVRQGGDADGPEFAVLDSKLARTARVTALLQVTAYAERLREAGVRVADQVGLMLGTGRTERFALDDLAPVYRRRRARLEAILDAHRAGDVPVAWGDGRYTACGRCAVCEPQVRAADDVLLVAHLTTAQRARLRQVGITTVHDLAAAPKELPAGLVMGSGAWEHLRAQAAIQVRQAEAGHPVFELVDAAPIHALPTPDPGDIYFDFEGDPLWTDADRWGREYGLEYLFGWVERPTAANPRPPFRALVAHDRTQEKQALVDFVAYVVERRRRYPGMHVYHYAPYEKTALLRLAARHGVCADEVDQLLRDGVLVDLYATVRAGLRVGAESYSIKKLEPLYMGDDLRDAEGVTNAADSVVEYRRACAVRESEPEEFERTMRSILDYNEYDCVSTLRLHAWLRQVAAAGAGAGGAAAGGAGPDVGHLADDAAHAAPGDAAAPDGATPGGADVPSSDVEVLTPQQQRRQEHRTAVQEAADRLLALAGDAPAAERTAAQQVAAQVAHSLLYWELEAKPFWWGHHDRLSNDPDDWADTRDTVVASDAQSVRVVEDWRDLGGRRGVGRLLEVTGQIAPGSLLRAGTDVWLMYAPPLPPCASQGGDRGHGVTQKGTVLDVAAADDGRDVVVVEERIGATDLRNGVTTHAQLPYALAPAALGINTVPLEAVLLEYAADVEAAFPDVPRGLAWDVLLRRPPRTSDGAPVHARRDGGDTADEIVEALLALDDSYLGVQGPPGTGKTYTGSRVVARLVAEHGWRVGVTAQSHEAVANFLRAVAGKGLGPQQVARYRSGADTRRPEGPWSELAKPADASAFLGEHAASGTGCVVGGTAWLFARGDDLDLLVVDEAGQFSLAPTLAAARRARRVLFLGDPQQLPQVSAAPHAEHVEVSALSWLLGGHATLPDSHGWFLDTSWRMHPALCEAVSALSYERRLHSAPATKDRSLEGVAPGVHPVEVWHPGDATFSPAEADAVVDLVRSHLGRTWTDPGERDPGRRERPLGQDDVLVVAPYNAQVATVRRALEAAGYDDVRVGTVDKFQGQEAPVVIVSMTASSAEDVPRGVEFLLNRNRLNVAVSRGQWCAYVVHSPTLAAHLPTSPERLLELGAFCGLLDGGVRGG
ncbi:TM0106 family RecB-like putative nuclease [Puerhibacterium puerhi]|uniref:TM0106 family RecB-like putative nuclease n=1 Tax=Puerhibacterium puerhi TaxID=2692623 RepID=UPI00135BC074|nr:TM0106 family RecB-like putative nuclease [Puerhibacterium puerhi]